MLIVLLKIYVPGKIAWHNSLLEVPVSNKSSGITYDLYRIQISSSAASCFSMN